jgi:hypothetical protein
MEAKRIVYNHTANEGKRSQREGQRQKMIGLKKGFPDIQVFDPPPKKPEARGVAIEMKRRIECRPQVSIDQEDWLEKLRQRGYIVKVCYGSDEAIRFMEELGF